MVSLSHNDIMNSILKSCSHTKRIPIWSYLAYQKNIDQSGHMIDILQFLSKHNVSTLFCDFDKQGEVSSNILSKKEKEFSVYNSQKYSILQIKKSFYSNSPNPNSNPKSNLQYDNKPNPNFDDLLSLQYLNHHIFTYCKDTFFINSFGQYMRDHFHQIALQFECQCIILYFNTDFHESVCPFLTICDEIILTINTDSQYNHSLIDDFWKDISIKLRSLEHKNQWEFTNYKHTLEKYQGLDEKYRNYKFCKPKVKICDLGISNHINDHTDLSYLLSYNNHLHEQITDVYTFDKLLIMQYTIWQDQKIFERISIDQIITWINEFPKEDLDEFDIYFYEHGAFDDVSPEDVMPIAIFKIICKKTNLCIFSLSRSQPLKFIIDTNQNFDLYNFNNSEFDEEVNDLKRKYYLLKTKMLECNCQDLLQSIFDIIGLTQDKLKFLLNLKRSKRKKI